MSRIYIFEGYLATDENSARDVRFPARQPYGDAIANIVLALRNFVAITPGSTEIAREYTREKLERDLVAYNSGREIPVRLSDEAFLASIGVPIRITNSMGGSDAHLYEVPMNELTRIWIDTARYEELNGVDSASAALGYLCAERNTDTRKFRRIYDSIPVDMGMLVGGTLTAAGAFGFMLDVGLEIFEFPIVGPIVAFSGLGILTVRRMVLFRMQRLNALNNSCAS